MSSTETLSSRTPHGDAELSRRCTIRWIDRKREEHTHAVDKGLCFAGLYNALPVRVSPNYPGKRNVYGKYWFASTGHLVPFDSLTERTGLLLLDFDQTVTAIASQPFEIDFKAKHPPKKHIPDFFYLTGDGRQTVADVKPAELIGQRAIDAFTLTEQVCDRVGWGYEVFTWIHPIYKINVEWLSKYRLPKYAPPVDIATEILDFFESARPLGATEDCPVPAPPPLILSWVYHLLWRRYLVTELDKPLSHRTQIRRAGADDHA